ncbi:transketolase [Alphaproteobacteria bacterium]|nr:transketolase [Alphaproteobacteria bacterium]
MKNSLSTAEIKNEGKSIRLELFQKYCEVKEGHPGSVLSIFDIVNYLYLSETIRINPGSETNDTFIMSKGHAASVQYPYLLRKGFIDQNDWDNWGRGKSNLRVFANTEIPGIDATSGSLGHGVGIAAGFALANRAIGKKTNNFVVISEGELYEGSTWEALLFVAHQRLTDVKIILDVNRNMILGRPDDLLSLEPLGEKFKAFNFNVMRINGHDYNEIENGVNFLMDSQTQPKVLIADTIKGKGVSFMEDKSESHYWGTLTENQMAIMLEDLKQ